MTELLLKLNQVPDDEAEEIRVLLAEADIDFYETSSGNWGASLAAIWLNDQGQKETVQTLLDEYQRKRAEAARLEPAEPWLKYFIRQPLKVVAFSLLIAALLYILLSPFLGMMLPD